MNTHALNRLIAAAATALPCATRLILLAALWASVAGVARADGDFEQAKFDLLVAELDSNQFGHDRARTKPLPPPRRRREWAGGLKFAQLAAIQSLAFNGPSLEVKRRAENIMQSLISGLPAADRVHPQPPAACGRPLDGEG